MKILHTSDWHLGITFNGVNITPDQEFFINQICEILENEDIDALIIAGDVFDKSVASSVALELYDRAVTRICGEMKVPTFIVAGNHDGASRLASCSNLLEKTGLYITGRLKENIKPVSFSFIVNTSLSVRNVVFRHLLRSYIYFTKFARESQSVKVKCAAMFFAHRYIVPKQVIIAKNGNAAI